MERIINITSDGVRAQVKRLRELVGPDVLPNARAYEAVAMTLGFANWDTLSGLLKQFAASEVAPAATPVVPDMEAVNKLIMGTAGLGSRASRMEVVDKLRDVGLLTVLPGSTVRPARGSFQLDTPFDLFLDLRAVCGDRFEDSWVKLHVDQAFVTQLIDMRTEYNRGHSFEHTLARDTSIASHRNSTRYTPEFPDGTDVKLTQPKLIADGVNWWFHAEVEPSKTRLFSRPINVEWFLKLICDKPRMDRAFAHRDKHLWTDSGLVMVTHPVNDYSLYEFVESLVQEEQLPSNALDQIIE